MRAADPLGRPAGSLIGAAARLLRTLKPARLLPAEALCTL